VYARLIGWGGTEHKLEILFSVGFFGRNADKWDLKERMMRHSTGKNTGQSRHWEAHEIDAVQEAEA